jgi:PAS domain S-box-containing protein
MDGKLRTIYIDDEPAGRDMAAEFSSHNDRIEFYTTATPDEGLALFDEQAIDCIVTEYNMPSCDGGSVLEAVRAEYPTLPVIFYTNDDSEAVVAETTATRNTDFVPKGYSTEHFQLLTRRIVAVTERRRADNFERVAALVRDIQSALARARTLEDIETSVCERLADADPYVFAWIGATDTDSPRVTSKASAGKEAGYFDVVEITADDSPTGQGPTGRALKTRSTHVVQNISVDPAYGPWREPALERNYRSSAAIPIQYDDTLYGVLNVYASHPKAFDSDERSLLEDLCETVAHAYHRIRLQNQYESQYQELFEDAPIMMAFTREVDDEPIIEDCNQRFADALGYSRTHLQGQPLAEFYTETSAERLLDRGGYQRSLEGEFTPKERELVTADGEQLITLLQATPRKNPRGDVIGTHALYVDITDRKRVESVLDQAKAMEASMDGMSILNEDHELIYLNQAHADIYGYDSPDVLLGHTWKIFYADEEIERLENGVLRALEKQGRWRGEATGKRKNGEYFDQELSLTRTDGGGLVCVVRDITQRKEYEEKIEKQRNSLELLNEVVRHDIRNDMAVVSGRADLLKRHVKEAGQDDLEAIQDAAESAIRLTKTARSLSEVMLSTDEDIESVELNEYLNPVVETIQSKYSKANVTTEIQIPDVRVRGNDLLKAVFQNLIQNAIVHNDKEVPAVRITTECDSETVRVRVADNGPGIPESRRDTIFGKGKKGLDSAGTGLGLYLVGRIVAQCGGDVRMEDNDPEGSVFIVELPRTAAQ